MPKKPGVYKGEKRKKELSRQKKQEEKRKRKFQSGDRPSFNTDADNIEQKEPANP